MLYTETKKPYDVGIYIKNGCGMPSFFWGFNSYEEARQKATEATAKNRFYYALLRDNTGARYVIDRFENGQEVIL